MQIGCGVRTMTVRNREYLYFWHYETRDGRRKAIHDYVGPARDPESGRKAIEALEGYTRKAIEEARRRLASEKVEAMAGTR
jgi:hypothetical protein